MNMSHRERALTALDHQEPDRVPFDLGATRNSGIHHLAYQNLLKHLGLNNEMVDRDDFGLSKVVGIAKPSEKVLQELDVDFRAIFLGEADFSRERILSNGDWQDELGVVRRQPSGSFYWDVVQSPFNREYALSDILNYPWPDPSDPGYIRGLRDKALHIRENTDYALVLHLHDIIIHPTQFLLGFEKWFTSFILEPELLSSLMDAVLDVRIEVTARALKEVGDLVDVVSCSDDMGDGRGPLVSMNMYRKFIKPRHLKFFDAIRSLTSAKVLYHSCGSIIKLIPDFIDLGIEILNPVQVSASGMETKLLKQEFGNQVTFWGAIDTTSVLPNGTTEDVLDEVKKRINDLAPGGGYVLAAVHNIQPDVPPQNILTMYQSAREYGVYPIH
jgi:uroporphyrinogen decarboxylase